MHNWAIIISFTWNILLEGRLCESKICCLNICVHNVKYAKYLVFLLKLNFWCGFNFSKFYLLIYFTGSVNLIKKNISITKVNITEWNQYEFFDCLLSQKIITSCQIKYEECFIGTMKLKTINLRSGKTEIYACSLWHTIIFTQSIGQFMP